MNHVWTVTIWRRDSAPEVFVYEDEETARAASKEFVVEIRNLGYSRDAAAVYLERNRVFKKGLVVSE